MIVAISTKPSWVVSYSLTTLAVFAKKQKVNRKQTTEPDTGLKGMSPLSVSEMPSP